PRDPKVGSVLRLLVTGSMVRHRVPRYLFTENSQIRHETVGRPKPAAKSEAQQKGIVAGLWFLSQWKVNG
ncbi:MAG: hypothetical protein ACOYLO_18090, partial [Ferruginibacter sp.]